jgi:hypothetical protein
LFYFFASAPVRLWKELIATGAQATWLKRKKKEIVLE